MRLCSGGDGLLTKLYLTLTIPWTVAQQAPPLSMGFPRQESCSGLPFPSPGDLPDPGVEPASLALQTNYLPPSHQEALSVGADPAQAPVLSSTIILCLVSAGLGV